MSASAPSPRTPLDRAVAHAESLLEADRADAALEALRTALAFDPSSISVRRLIAECHLRLGDLAAAETVLTTILRAAPRDIPTLAQRARVLFLMQRWDEAWRAYRVRFALMDNPPRCFRRSADGTRHMMAPWSGDGTPERLLVMCEQGLGDTLQFVRFLPQLRARGIRPALVTPQRLIPLLAASLPDVDLLPAETPVQGLPSMPWIPLLDLPATLRLAPDTYGAPTPYLAADPARVADWTSRLPTSGLKIGICWAGNPANTTDARRSMPLAALEPLASTSAHLISLQIGSAANQAIDDCAFASRIQRLDGEVDTQGAFLDTAAIMMNLDLVVTVDTAIAHLAGALGCRTAILLPRHVADWRWMRGERTTLWYPTTRLYRQHRFGDWRGAVGDLMSDIAAETSGRKVRRAPSLDRKPQVPVSVGELLDKLSILQLKVGRIQDPVHRAHAADEFAALSGIARPLFEGEPALQGLFDELHEVNATLWDIETRMRQFEAARRFDEVFVATAREVYRNNDRRAAMKRRINDLTRSVLVEVKDYGPRAA
jgi:Tetratricopeptide repeat